MNDYNSTSQEAANASDGEDNARRQAYIAWSRKQWRKNYYKKHSEHEKEKARIRAKKRQITDSTPPEIAEERRKRHREVQARYYARKRLAEAQRQAAYRLSLLAGVDQSDDANEADDEKECTDEDFGTFTAAPE